MGSAKKVLLTAALMASALGVAPVSQAGAAPGSPMVKAHPHSVMIGMSTTLRGRGFPASTSVQLQECGFKFWMAPAEPCLAQEPVSVMTDAKGRFETSFRVGLCPEGKPTKKPTQRVCYVGELITGEDTGRLTGAARLVVTYP